MSWARAATLAKLKPRAGSWNTGVKALRERQLIFEQGGLVRIAKPTPSAGVPPGLAAYRAALGGRASDILGILARDSEATREAIAAELGVAPRGRSWNTSWKALRDNGLIVEDGAAVHWPKVWKRDGFEAASSRELISLPERWQMRLETGAVCA